MSPQKPAHPAPSTQAPSAHPRRAPTPDSVRRGTVILPVSARLGLVENVGSSPDPLAGSGSDLDDWKGVDGGKRGGRGETRLARELGKGDGVSKGLGGFQQEVLTDTTTGDELGTEPSSQDTFGISLNGVASPQKQQPQSNNLQTPSTPLATVPSALDGTPTRQSQQPRGRGGKFLKKPPGEKKAKNRTPKVKVQAAPKPVAVPATATGVGAGQAITPGPSRPTRATAATQTPKGTPSASASKPPQTPTTPSTPLDPKGKGKAVERRVLPARIRRATGGGAEGMRDVEEMIIDWVQRWGEPVTTPPDDMPILVTTISLDLLQPPVTTLFPSNPNAPTITLTPSRPSISNHPFPPADTASTTTGIVDHGGEQRLKKEEMIETPEWVMVKPGDDDMEEAREELGGGIGKAKVHTSPVKRLRKVHDEPEEDTSDAHYAGLHRKFEAFERRQRLREKEKLQFERYKMGNRIELLKQVAKPSWASIVSTILARGTSEWDAGRKKVEKEGEEWLRERLVKEGREVMKRYDELLPAESRKQKGDRHSSPSQTPEPSVLPARVAALRDPAFTSSKSSKRKRSSISLSAETAKEEETPKKAAKASNGQRRSQVFESGEYEEVTPSRRKNSIKTHQPPNISEPPALSVLPTAEPLFVPPLTASGMPVLVEAASRRELAIKEQEESKSRSGAPREGRLIKYEKTRISRRLDLVSPFGMPVPGVVEYKSEFTLTDEEDFWPIIAEREEKANQHRRQSLLNTPGTPGPGLGLMASSSDTTESGSSGAGGGSAQLQMSGMVGLVGVADAKVGDAVVL
ncbi:hypothetical protein L198_02413 [Cryptococcus wingfieldii CBS 7118]|uniref:Something about silencing protein 4 domain-containing protein n=1 Tax=Cryptococcus wingfieldii CBS 7118 TaxID=1295528 RepID=A0A1E3JRU6_9TREE|nr:hypothetical protein L198_02413 [Cryptococcus wingfieldii CBS 7118]ODO03565.1 hypothetical protein L198_02413 [Cryptococcus wingfieldii CBS 7118]